MQRAKHYQIWALAPLKTTVSSKNTENLERSKTQGFHRFFENSSEGSGETSGTTTNQPSKSPVSSITPVVPNITHVPNNLTTFTKRDW